MGLLEACYWNWNWNWNSRWRWNSSPAALFLELSARILERSAVFVRWTDCGTTQKCKGCPAMGSKRGASFSIAVCVSRRRCHLPDGQPDTQASPIAQASLR
jgi:hypothetical protein